MKPKTQWANNSASITKHFETSRIVVCIHYQIPPCVEQAPLLSSDLRQRNQIDHVGIDMS